MPVPKVLITTSSFDMGLPEISDLQDSGYEIVQNPYGRRLTGTELLELVGDDLEGVIAGVEPWGCEAMDKSPNLKVISRCGIGMDSVDQKSAEARGIVVLNTPDAPTKAVAELTIALILSALRYVPQQDLSIRQGGWDRPMGRLFCGKTLGLIGYGRIGQAVAFISKGFGAEVIFYDPLYKGDSAGGMDLDDLLQQADIVSLHIPYNEQNHYFIGAAQIERMKDSAIFINASRGGLVDESALMQALQSGKLAAAALDVYEKEPYDGPLKILDNVILTSHTGSYAKEARQEQERLAARNLLEALTGKVSRAL